MWNRQREAEEPREKLALAGEAEVAPNRNPPPVEDVNTEAASVPFEAPADAAEEDKACRFTIRAQIVPITPEGYPFIGAFALASLVLFWLWSPLGWLGTLATIWCAYFF